MIALLLLACTDLAPEVAGYTETTATTSDGTELTTAVWYPAVEGGARVTYEGEQPSDAFLDAPPASGPFPVVLFSHGSGGWRQNGSGHWEALARAGFVVVSADHVGNTWIDEYGTAEFLDVMVRRPDDLVAALDATEALAEDPDSPLFELLDLTEIGVVGHSTGGATALMATGGGIDRATVVLGCSAGQLDGVICDIAADSDDDLLTFQPAGLPPVAASVLLAPLSAGVIPEDGLRDVEAATMVMVGTDDPVLPPESNGEPIFDYLPDPKAMATFEGAGHYGFADLCDVPGVDEVAPDVSAECDGAFLDQQVVLSATTELTLGWLDAHLRGNAEVDLEGIASGYADVRLD